MLAWARADGCTVLVEVAFAVELARVLGVLGVGCVLEQLDDLLGREVVSDAAYLSLQGLDVALAADHLLLLHLHQ